MKMKSNFLLVFKVDLKFLSAPAFLSFCEKRSKWRTFSALSKMQMKQEKCKLLQMTSFWRSKGTISREFKIPNILKYSGEHRYWLFSLNSIIRGNWARTDFATSWTW